MASGRYFGIILTAGHLSNQPARLFVDTWKREEGRSLPLINVTATPSPGVTLSLFSNCSGAAGAGLLHRGTREPWAG